VVYKIIREMIRESIETTIIVRGRRQVTLKKQK